MMETRLARPFTLSILSGSLCLALIAPAKADDNVQIFSGSKRPSKEQIIEALDPPKLRGVSPGTMAGGMPVPTPKASFEQIKFEFDSSKLTPEAIGVLKEMGAALTSDRLAGSAIQIEGHTDATGSDAYNKDLSMRRAEAVKQYLVGNYKIDRTLFKTVGKGESDLLDKAKPDSGANRRVVFAREGK